MAFAAAHPTFRTNDLGKARAAARSLVEGRQSTPRALFPHEAEGWVAKRFPGLNERDRAKLVVEVQELIGLD
jgi:hypothetical protein